MTDLRIETEYAQPLRSGEVLGARYRLEDVAGAGGMATVWRAYDERLQRPVAIKVISDALATNPSAVARFAREARTHARIQHPNLVQVYDYSVTASQPYLVMEYINGCTLSERLDRGAFSEAEIRALAVEMLSAIACVHSHGVLHRDIKSGNVLLDKDGHARLTDFGLARLEDSTQITRTNEVVGTLRFLAPELIEGRPASRQSDLYALGVLLRTTSGDGQHASASLQKLIGWMTKHDPDARPPDAHAVLTALRGGQRRDVLKPPAAKPRPVVVDEPTRTLSITRRSRRTSERSRKASARAGRAPADERTSPHRYTARRRLGTRTAAVSALLIAAVVIVLAVFASAGGGTGGAPAGSRATSQLSTSATGTRAGATDVDYSGSAGQARHALTIDQQLQQLAGYVRRAARP